MKPLLRKANQGLISVNDLIDFALQQRNSRCVKKIILFLNGKTLSSKQKSTIQNHLNSLQKKNESRRISNKKPISGQKTKY